MMSKECINRFQCFYRLIKLTFYENKIVLQEVGLSNVLYLHFHCIGF